MTTIIHSGDPASLLKHLAEHTLEPDFEAYGNFIQADLCRPKWDADQNRWVDDPAQPIYPDTPGMVRFFGNFHNYSAVFRFDTNDQALIDQLTAAIRANQQTPAYLAAKQANEAQRQQLKKATTSWHQ